MVPAARVGVLGGFSLHVHDEPVELSPSVQRLVSLLALHQRPLQRLYVAATLWIDASEEHAGASLRTALWRIRTPHGALVRAHGGMLMLDPTTVVDLWDQTRRAQTVLSDTAPRSPGEIATFCDACDVLPDWYEDWVIIVREQFRQLRLHALERLCEGLAADERFAEATLVGLAAVAAEPLRESAHRVLIRAHLSEGNVNEAVRQYVSYRGLLRRELDLAPTAAMERLLSPYVHRDAAVT